MRLEFHSYKVCAIRVHRVNSDETVAVSGDNIAVLLELNARHVRARWLKWKSKVGKSF